MKASLLGWADGALFAGLLVLSHPHEWIAFAIFLPLNVVLIGGFVAWKRKALPAARPGVDYVALRQLRNKMLYLVILTTTGGVVAFWAGALPAWGLGAPCLLVVIWLYFSHLVSKGSSRSATDGTQES